MASSRVKLASKVKTPVVVVDAAEEGALARLAGQGGLEAASLLHAPGFLLIDNYPWTAPVESLQKFQENKERAYDTPFSTVPNPEGLEEALAPFKEDWRRLFILLYGPTYPVEAIESIRHSWRPMISKNEPIHFDSNYEPGTISITSYMNFSQKPREYALSHSMPWLIANQPKETLKAAGAFPTDPKRFCTELRGAAAKGAGPLGKAPRHRLWMATGSVWFFDPKLVSHELVAGDGTVCYTWRVKADANRLPEYYLNQLVKT